MESRQHLGLKVYGVVQGVGFRPFIYQLARRFQLAGVVRNTSAAVEIEVEGAPAELRSFVQALQDEAPPAARIARVETKEGTLAGYRGFTIEPSLAQAGGYQLISPDLATCPACRDEIFDPANRRYRYPFTNCTNCGPRFTIIEDIPYDRPSTTMRNFVMCPQCQSEYDDPTNRRFHAQPNACPLCGPRLELLDIRGERVPGDPLHATAGLLREGRIAAIKGLGGFLLACDATNEEAVATLRKRKRRPAKPFAVMLRDMAEVRDYCQASPDEETLLGSAASPIVLLKLKEAAGLAAGVAPGLRYLGVMLPYTPLHHLMMSDTGLPLVMTSGNMSEEPIAQENAEALERLGSIADYFLVHNRPIAARYDDSVVMHEEGPRLLRRARGYAPYPIPLAFQAPAVLACGAELKSAFCLTRDNYAFLSQHIGDLENAETLANFENTIELYERLFRIQPRVLAHDLHPDYLSTRYARRRAEENPGLALFPVQHHHAHVASLLAEHGISEPVLGVALDGTGYGTDGAIWGGEFIRADLKGFTRLAHLEYLPLPGGDAATRSPYRTAAGYLYALLGEGALTLDIPALRAIDPGELALLKIQVDRRVNAPLTSSCGRLFDAVAALIGRCERVTYEAQAAIDLEMVATGFHHYDGRRYLFPVDEANGVRRIRLKALFSAILDDIGAGRSQAEIAARFHHSLAHAIGDMAVLLAKEQGLTSIAVSGGVFQNRLLARLVREALAPSGLRVLNHALVPPNDGCIALGQAAIASTQLG
jgi:hydrogenase maturation protein HypF